MLVVSSVLIAAAGYIINDYFDINIDQINKPTANVVDKIVSRRWAMAWHFVLSGVGILLSAWVAWRTGFWYILFGNFICVLLLFGYSVSLKRKLLFGNIVISLLTAWVILGYWFCGIILLTLFTSSRSLKQRIRSFDLVFFMQALHLSAH